MSFPPPTERQARLIWTALSGLAAATLVALAVALIWGLGRILDVLSNVLWPLAAAAVLACLLDPLVGFLEQRGVPRLRAIVVVFAVALLLLAGVTASVIPRVVVETRQLQERVPAFAEKLQRQITDLVQHPPAALRRIAEALFKRAKPPSPTGAPTQAPAAPQTEPTLFELVDPETLAKLTGWMSLALEQVGLWLKAQAAKLTSLFALVAGLALVPIYAFYFLLEKRGIAAHWRDYLPVRESRVKEELVFVLGAINQYLVAFFRGQVLVALCDGALYTIGFLLIGLPYAVLIGVMATVLTIIPFLGAIVTTVTALGIALVAGGWKLALLVVLVVAAVQLIEGTVLQPKILGDRVGLHPVVIIIALMTGTTLLGGILGGILAIPLAAALRVILFRYVWRRREPASPPAAT
jgi:predicted PurR-regulated permease PerM